MAGRTGCVGEGFQFALFLLFGGFGDVDFVKLGHSCGDGAGLAEDGDFKQTGVDGAREVGDLLQLEQRVSNPFRDSVVFSDPAARGHTRSFVCRISSGVFSSRLCAASILRLHSSMYFCISRI